MYQHTTPLRHEKRMRFRMAAKMANVGPYEPSADGSRKASTSRRRQISRGRVKGREGTLPSGVYYRGFSSPRIIRCSQEHWRQALIVVSSQSCCHPHRQGQLETCRESYSRFHCRASCIPTCTLVGQASLASLLVPGYRFRGVLCFDVRPTSPGSLSHSLASVSVLNTDTMQHADHATAWRSPR